MTEERMNQKIAIDELQKMIESLLKENDYLQKASGRFQAELVTASDYIL